LKFFTSRRGGSVAGIVLVLALFVARPGVQRLRARVVRSISLALGRQVDVESVRLRFLPQPGFELRKFVVHDDPSFGAEPVLQSSDVIALVRVGSLLRGRLEIARLSLTEPSLNLVRNSEGHWNLETLVERAAKTPVAPTAKARNEARPGFPYIEAEHGRINLKFGQEKKPYSLTEANFALWQDSENAWGVRLKAQPMRTDSNLTDTGLVELDGSWQRAASLYETPVKFAAQWEGAQLGQLTKLTLGQDKGWRGNLSVSATLTGTPQDLEAAADASIQDFRRYDIAGGKAMRLAASCSGHYSTSDHIVSQLACRAPVGDGGIAVNGRVGLLSAAHQYDVTMQAQGVPVQPLLELARRVKKNIPADLVAAGKADATVTLQRDAKSLGPLWQGGGAVTALIVRSPSNNIRFALERIPFEVTSKELPLKLRPEPESERGSAQTKLHRAQYAMQSQLEVGPFALGLGKPTSATVHGQFSRSGYNVTILGDAELPRLLELGRTAGLPTLQLAATGEARINLHVSGIWTDFAAPVVGGTAQIDSVRARVRGLNEPLEIVSATLSLASDATEVRKLTLVAAGNTWRGSMTLPRQCSSPRACPVRFDLRAEEFATDSLSAGAALAGKQPWYHFLSSAGQTLAGQPPPFLASVHAIGKLSAGQVLIHSTIASRVSADAELEQGHLRLTNLQGDILGGHHRGEWTADFTAKPPTYIGSGTLEKISLSQIATAMHDDWIAGTASAQYNVKTLGWSKAELLAGAVATLQVEALDGSLPHLVLTGEGPALQVNRFVGRLRLHDKTVEIEEGKLQTPTSIYQLSGSASFNQAIDMKLARDGSRAFNITGTLTQPHVVVNAGSDTQAALKP
jgi:hypothetical protein